jgi:UDP-N-acetylmuramyl pentapeptide phosphotransferase/UDP-N-acetylglucosamine-1-phosphate transferase
MQPMLFAFALSFLLCAALAQSSSLLSSFIRQNDLTAVQSMHTKPTLRLAGLALFVSILMTDIIFAPEPGVLRLLLLSSLPMFALGLLEDLGIHQAPSRRLVSSIVAGGIFIAVTGTYLQDPGTFLIDWLFEYWLIAVGFTLFITAGIVHAFNLIDGLNGLSGSTALIACSGIAAISHQAGLPQFALPSAIICGAVIGFLALNFPFGKLFLGDAGAYGIGFLLSWLSLAVLNAATEVSPWAMLMMFFWPIADTALTIWRRLNSGRPVGHPDRLHFHQVIMRLIRLSAFGRRGRLYSNPLATVVVFPFMATPPLFGVMLWDSNSLSALCFCLFAALFSASYILAIKSARRFRMRRAEPELRRENLT